MTLLIGLIILSFQINSPIQSVYKLSQPVNILITGLDTEYDRSSYSYKVKANLLDKQYTLGQGRTDTIILAQFNPVTNQIVALNIPRDTRVYLNKTRKAKINMLNTLGGVNYLVHSLEGLLDIKIHNIIQMNSQAFVKIIDQMGGIEVNIPYAMKYQDKTDSIIIDLKRGKQTLTGKEALGFIRYRKTNLGDIGRIQNQQVFLRALKAKLKNPSLILRIPKVLKIVRNYIRTDLNTGDIFKLASFGAFIKNNQIIMTTLPGNFTERPKPICKTVTVSTANSNLFQQSLIAPNKPNALIKLSPYERSHSSLISGLTADNNLTSNQVTTKTICNDPPAYTSYWIPNKTNIKSFIQKYFKTATPNLSYINNNIPKYIDLKSSVNNRAKTSQVKRLLQKNAYKVLAVQNNFYWEDTKNTYIFYQKGNKDQALHIKKILGLQDNVKILGNSIGSPEATITIILGEATK